LSHKGPAGGKDAFQRLFGRRRRSSPSCKRRGKLGNVGGLGEVD
jgi:hypothetical protein